MADTTFVDYAAPAINAAWLNDVNDHVYNGLSLDGKSIINAKDPTYGCVGDGVTDDTAAALAAINAAKATNGTVFFPAGTYRFDSELAISNVRGLTMLGAAATLPIPNTISPSNTTFVFNNSPSGADGLVFSDFVGLHLSNIVIVQRRGNVGGGRALYLNTGHDFSINNVKVDSETGSTGKGIVFGGGTGGTSTFQGKISNCKVFCQDGASFESNVSNTSLTFISCYQVDGYFSFNGTTYSSVISCASELSPTYGYVLEGSSNISLVSCGAEANTKGAFYLTGCANIVLQAPYGAANNTSADVTIGDLIQMDSAAGACDGITIINPTSVSPNAATVQNIYANAGNGLVDISGVTTTYLSRGINGNATWLTTKLTQSGDYEVVSWTPTLVGWTNVGTPTVTGKYVKKGNVVFFSVVIVPATSISCTLLTSTITGLPFTTPPSAIASMVDGNTVSYGNVAINATTGVIYPQTSGVLTTSITISGSFILY